jgi:hypothetical protein
MKKERYSASIVRDKDGVIRIHVARGAPALPDPGEIIEVLYGDDESELKERAIRFVRELP